MQHTQCVNTQYLQHTQTQHASSLRCKCLHTFPRQFPCHPTNPGQDFVTVQPWHLPLGEYLQDFSLTRFLLSLSSSLKNLCPLYMFAVGCACGGFCGTSCRGWVDFIFQLPILS